MLVFTSHIVDVWFCGDVAVTRELVAFPSITAFSLLKKRTLVIVDNKV